MLPRFAAAVWSTTSFMVFAGVVTLPAIIIARGTKMMRATSFVTIMEEKKGSRTRKRERILRLGAFFTRRQAALAKKPQLSSPDVTDMRQNSRQSTRQSMYSKYSADGGTKKAETTVRTAEMQRTASFAAKAFNFLINQNHLPVMYYLN